MKYLINLLPEKEQSTSDKIIYFSFHYLRYILVITQFVAICVFFYRFKVDQDIVDMRDTLIQKKAIVDATQSLLEEVKDLDKKISTIKTYLNQQKKAKNLYGYIFGAIPPNIILSKLYIEGGDVEVEGVSGDINIIRQFYEKMKADNHFAQANLTTVNKTKDGYTFRISLVKYK